MLPRSPSSASPTYRSKLTGRFLWCFSRRLCRFARQGPGWRQRANLFSDLSDLTVATGVRRTGDAFDDQRAYHRTVRCAPLLCYFGVPPPSLATIAAQCSSSHHQNPQGLKQRSNHAPKGYVPDNGKCCLLCPGSPTCVHATHRRGRAAHALRLRRAHLDESAVRRRLPIPTRPNPGSPACRGHKRHSTIGHDRSYKRQSIHNLCRRQRQRPQRAHAVALVSILVLLSSKVVVGEGLMSCGENYLTVALLELSTRFSAGRSPSTSRWSSRPGSSSSST
jgi:hypothetical protein